jgi:hypothetical protein
MAILRCGRRLDQRVELHKAAATRYHRVRLRAVHHPQQAMQVPNGTLTRRLALASGAACLLAASARGGATLPTRIRHNFSGQQNAGELGWEAAVLNLVLEKSRAKYGPYELEKVEGISQNRAFSELTVGNLDVVSSMTDLNREEQATPIRYCLFKGLLGVRLGLGLPATVAQLEGIASLEELQKVELGLVFDWPDFNIQTDAGLKVTRLPSFSAGLAQLKLGHPKLLPMGLTEAQPIAKAQDLAVVRSWAIAYPTAYYFFASHKNPQLAERLNHGFEQAVKDKSFDALFAKKLDPVVAAAGLDKRRLFVLRNPYLSTATPWARKELWHPLVLQKILQ